MTTGAELLARCLRQSGVRRAFAYPGTSEISLCVALADALPDGLRQPYGDAAAVFMAAGAAASRPGSAAAVLHGARGVGAAFGALGDVARNEWGVVVLAGLPSTTSARFLPPHGEPHLLDAVAPFVRATVDLSPYRPEDVADADVVATILGDVAEAVARAARAPRGPVVIGVPQDLADAPWATASPRPAGPPGAPAGPVAAPGELDRAVTLLGASRRVGVLFDDYLLRPPGAAPALARFAARYRAPVFQVRYRRGPMLFASVTAHEIPQFVGALAPEDPAYRAFLDEVDLLVTVEDRNMYRRVVGDLPSSPKIAITSWRERTAKNDYLTADDVVLEGDCAAILDALADGGEGSSAGHWLTTPAAPLRPAAGPGRPLQGLARALIAAVTASGTRVLVDDSQLLGGAVAAAGEDGVGSLTVYGDHGGYVGSGLAFAAGVAMAEGPALCTVGDHALVNGFQALFPLVRYRVPLTVVLASNGGSVSMHQQARDSYGAAAAAIMTRVMAAPRVDVEALGRALGLTAVSVEVDGSDDGGLPEVEREITAALRSHRPRIVELRLPPALDYWTGIWRSRGLDETGAGEGP